jgi:putative oxidoreductase
MSDFLNSWSPRILSVLRILTGFLLLWHGSQKLFGFPPSQQGGGALPPIMMVGGILEFFGGILFLVGFLTRPVAFLLSGLMAVAYFGWHASSGKGFLPLMNGGELAVLYCFVFLYFFFAGGGLWSVDSLFKKNV